MAATVGAQEAEPGAAAAHAAASQAATPSSPLTLTPSVMASELSPSSFKPARVFKPEDEPDSFTSISFTDDGKFAVAAADDEELHILDAYSGTYKRKIAVHQHGVGLVRCTHSNSAVLHTSTRAQFNVQYLALDEHKYVRSFRGHEGPIVSLAVCPKDDTFLTGGDNDAVKVWDLRKPTAVGSLEIANHSCVAYDPAGMIFAVGLNLKMSVSLYDRRAFNQQPFLTFVIDDMIGKTSEPGRTPILTSLQFSNDGSCLLVGTSSDLHFVLDAFDGRILARLVTEEQTQGFMRAGPGLERATESPHTLPIEPTAGISGEELSWSPDGRFIVSGSIDGKLNIWDMQTTDERAQSGSPYGPMHNLFPLKTLDAHGSPSRAVQFNPQRAMFASAGREVAFWLPDLTA
ncbi:hypothetical protein OIV83_002699 [Microbotryomycetes sp. JL201]|nr:hypothetical protein OIV83_002699 [Microbotryomycetes sp. JL201]